MVWTLRPFRVIRVAADRRPRLGDRCKPSDVSEIHWRASLKTLLGALPASASPSEMLIFAT